MLLLTTGDNGGAMQACLRALECGSQSPNTHDCLADAAGRLGRIDLAVQYGRAALEAKDRMFSAYPALATMPTTGMSRSLLKLADRAPLVLDVRLRRSAVQELV